MSSKKQQTTSPSPAAKTKGGYGGRSWGQKVVIYLIGAVIVYGLIYLIFFHKTAGGGGLGY